MRPDEPKTFDPHEHIDLSDEGKVAEMIEKLDVSRDELIEAVEKVGSQPVAVALFLGRADAV
ncbi:MAG: hypothetical protein K0Q62_767 [Phenylobacterium sp.]|jgi:enolase|nr:hypothetical protein [Phenylobacterium sp.]HVK41704.1 DUF3606 domain-containing protein [Phenylobacterium sp.]